MTKEQLEVKFEFGLKYLNIHKSVLNGNGFKHKEVSKKSTPVWPRFFNMISAEGFEYLDMSCCSLTKNDMELMSYALHLNPVGTPQIKVLNLSRNTFMKEGAKIIATALEGN